MVALLLVAAVQGCGEEPGEGPCYRDGEFMPNRPCHADEVPVCGEIECGTAGADDVLWEAFECDPDSQSAVCASGALPRCVPVEEAAEVCGGYEPDCFSPGGPPRCDSGEVAICATASGIQPDPVCEWGHDVLVECRSYGARCNQAGGPGIPTCVPCVP